MRLSKKNQPEDVYEWLVIATQGLVLSEQKRIWAEILAHHAESVAAHQADGLEEPEAQKAALAELGDVYAAQKSFRTMYLLEKEEKRLRRLLDEYRARNTKKGLKEYLYFIIPLASVTMLVGAVTSFFFSSGDRSISFQFLYLGIALLPIYASAVIFLAGAKCQDPRKALRSLVIGNALNNLATVVMIFVYFLPAISKWWHAIPLVVVISLWALGVWRAIRLVKKIPNDFLEQAQS